MWSDRETLEPPWSECGDENSEEVVCSSQCL